MKLRILFGLLLISSLVACAPEPESKTVDKAAYRFGPLLEDTPLKFEGSSQFANAPFDYFKTINTGQFFSMIENLSVAGDLLGNPDLNRISTYMSNKFYESSDSLSLRNIEDSLYFKMAVGETRPIVETKVEEIVPVLQSELELVSSILDESEKSFPWKQNLTLDEAPQAVSEFLRYLITQINAKNANGFLNAPIEQEIRAVLSFEIPTAHDLLKQVVAAKTLAEAMRILNELKTKLGMTLSQETEEQLKLGSRLGRLIDDLDSEQKALALIVEFWKQMTPEERKTLIRPASRELYDFLKARSGAQLKCLKSDSCLRPFIIIAKAKLFAEIRKFGIKQLKNDFNEGSLKYVQQAMLNLVPTLPQEITLFAKAALNDRIQSKLTELKSTRMDYANIAQNLLSSWARANLSLHQHSYRGLEPSFVSMSLDKKMSLKPVSNFQRLESSTLGTTLRYHSYNWKKLSLTGALSSDESGKLRTQLFEQINKLPMTLGFNQSSGDVFSSYMLSFTGPRDQNLTLQTLVGKEDLFFIPDTLILTKSLEPDKARSSYNMRVSNFSDLISGYSGVAEVFKDWKRSIVDEHLSDATVAQLGIADLPEELSRQSLFPKDKLFAAAIGSSAGMLLNLSKVGSPLFVINTKNELNWAENEDLNGATPSVMAGIVDIIEGKRSGVVLTQNIARFILALADFYQATNEIEKTKSEELRHSDKERKSPLEQILEARKQIKELMVGLSNFLAYKLKNEDGSFKAGLYLNKEFSTYGAASLNDQLLAIQALLRSTALLNTPVYSWAALDGYFYMNKSLWSSTAGFYLYAAGANQVADLETYTLALRVLPQLRSYLKVESQQQLHSVLSLTQNKLVKTLSLD